MPRSLTQFLESDVPLIHFAPDELGHRLLEYLNKVREHGFELFLIPTVKSKQELMRKMAESMSFPEYFGRNWDALDECIRDMGWIKAAGYILVVQNADVFWTVEPDEFRVFFEVCRDATQFWKSEGIPFHVVFIGSKSLKSWIQEHGGDQEIQIHQTIEESKRNERRRH